MELRREGLLSKTARLDYMIFKTEVREEPHGCQEESTPGKRTWWPWGRRESKQIHYLLKG